MNPSIPSGHASHRQRGRSVIVNNTFVCNSSAGGTPLTPKGYGGAIQIDYKASPAANAIVLNNIFYGNVTRTGYGNSVAFTDSATGGVYYCDAWADSSPYYWAPGIQATQTNCISANPLFTSINPANPANDNYQLSTSPTLSPCVDAGALNGAPPYNVVPNHDINGNPRPDSTSDPGVDMWSLRGKS